MDKKYLYLFFGLMVIAQLFVPIQMILSSENILTEGTAYKFKTVPRDPFDPFRGKFIRLRYEVERTGMGVGNTTIKTGGKKEPIYALLSTDGEGYALIDTILFEKPDDVEYLKIDKYQIANMKYYIDLPFDKFFMNEYLAQPAEDVVRSLRSDTTKTVYALVNVLDGRSVLKDVMINNTSIADYVREESGIEN